MKSIDTLLNALIVILAVAAIVSVIIMVMSQPTPIWTVREDMRLNDEIKELKEHIEMLNSHDGIDRGAIPQWFIDEFRSTFIGSYMVNIEDDTLNLVIITSGKRFSKLSEAIGGDGYLGYDVYIDVLDWEQIDEPELELVVPNDKPEEN